jgi:hypothetical protein
MYDIGGKTRRKESTRWVDNIKMNLREIWWYAMECTDLSHNRKHWRDPVNVVINLQDP